MMRNYKRSRMLKRKFIAILLSFLMFSLSVSEVFATGFNLQYDVNGNLLQSKDNYYEYDEFNNLARVRQNNATGDILEEYAYDDQGDRVKKIVYFSGGGNETSYYVGNDYVRKINSSGVYNLIYYYDGDVMIGKNDSGKMLYSHPDHLGSTNLVTNASGDVYEETMYYPFGLL